MESSLPRRLATLAVCLMLASLSTAQYSNSYCTQETSNPKDLNDHPRPKLDYSYTTQITGKWVHEKTMQVMHEYFDKDQNKFAYESVYGGHGFTEIFDVKNRYSIWIYGNSVCSYSIDVGRLDHFKSGKKSIEVLFNVGKEWKYKGDTTIRGVKVQQWRSCSSKQGWSNYTADYYFTKTTQLPFRLDLIGKEYDIKHQLVDMRVVYDYFLFSKAKPSPEVFDPPPGQICNNGTTVRTPPIVMSGSFWMETIDPKAKKVSETLVFYDKQKQLSAERTGDKTVVNDYGRGIRFEINKKTDECTRKALTRFADSGQTVDNKGMIDMASLRHFLFDDGNFTYNGVRLARGIRCDVYTKKSHAGEALGSNVIEIYIARPEIKITNNEGSIANSLQQPVRVVMMGGEDYHNLVVKRQYEIYDFLPEEFPYNWPFDLTRCYDNERTITFKMTLKGQAADSWHWENVLRRNASGVIADALRLSLLRVHIEDASVGESFTTLRGQIYDKEYPFTLFQPVWNMKLNETLKANNFFQYNNKSNTPSICADYCVRPKERPFKFQGFCPGFEFDRSTKACTFYTDNLYRQAKHDENLQYSRNVDFYRESVSSHNDWATASYSYSKLERLVVLGMINVTDSIGDVLIATDLTKVQQEAYDFDPSKYQAQDGPMKYFTNATGVLSTEPVEVLANFYIGACARHCLNTLKYNCEAFAYDTQKQTCTLYDSNSVRESYSQDKKVKMSFIYTRNYFSDFEEYSGRSVLSPQSDAVYTSVKDPNACAELCVKEDEFYCQSFEICDQTCLLGHKHIYNAPASSVNQDFSCKHYSRAYIQDYAKTQNKAALTDSKLVEIGNIGVKQCASLCSTSSSYVCDAFEFCDTDSLCRLTTQSTSDASLQYKDSGKCDLYTRKGNRQRFIYSKETSGSDDGSHSPGSMAGIALGMVILGVLVMAVGLLVFFRLRSPGRAADGMSVGFSRKQMDED